MCGYSHDITERKRRGKQVLQESEETIRSVLNTSSVAMVLLNKEGTNILWALLPPETAEHRRKEVEVVGTGKAFMGENF
jgi:hypothetical protein